MAAYLEPLFDFGKTKTKQMLGRNNALHIQMDTKYTEFADKFEALCDEYAAEDFDAKELIKVCEEIIESYA